jgi:hypothetical protein
MKHNVNLSDYEMRSPSHPNSPLKRSLVGLNSALLVKWFGALRVEEQRHSCDDARMYCVEGESGRYYFNSVVGYAVANGDCPITSLARTRKRKQPLWWMSQTASVIDGRAKPMPRGLVERNGLVILAGRCFRVVRGNHENDYRLVQMNVPKMVEQAVAWIAARTCDRTVGAEYLGEVTRELRAHGIDHRTSGGPNLFTLYFPREHLDAVDKILRWVGARA